MPLLPRFVHLSLLLLVLPCIPLARAKAQDVGPAAGQEAPAYRVAVERAVAAYGASDFAVARQQFERAHQVYPNARTLRGLGMAELALHDAASAVQHLEQALGSRVLPLEGSLRAAAEQTLREARQQLAEQSAPDTRAPLATQATPVEAPPGGHERGTEGTAGEVAPTPSEPPLSDSAQLPSPTPTTRTGLSRSGPWLVAGLSAGALVAGVVMLSLARQDRRALEDAERGSEWAEARDDYERHPRRVAAGAVLLGVGVVGISAGLAWHWQTRSRERQLTVGIGAHELRLVGRF